MKVPDKEFFEKNQVHLEMLDVNGIWKRIDTFYDYATAVNHGVNKFFSTPPTPINGIKKTIFFFFIQ